jgi:BirA family transcriptional regulator, biotin operon repressor / biotin---[acetyl-CoA-carboxylase] ligase
VTDLLAEGANSPPPQAVVEILADFLKIWLERWRVGGLAPILKSWQSCTHRHGTALSVHLPSNEILEGLYSGLNEDGALMLRLANGEIRAIHAADVFLI